ncbi:ArsR family transcriptional regulator [Mesorhizobium sp. L103C119B0]|nr:ArsR family transcriptional regulator [Mesorhizobium sp. LNJC394B00]ESZ61007.1 ArsR family transcriptional regulator [Mesorhizobium sp. L103C119B0]
MQRRSSSRTSRKACEAEYSRVQAPATLIPSVLVLNTFLLRAGVEGVPAGEVASRSSIVQNTMSPHVTILGHASRCGRHRKSPRPAEPGRPVQSIATPMVRNVTEASLVQIG